MVNGLFVLLFALLVSTVSVFVVLRLTTRFRIFDSIDERKIHTGEVPRLGGIGIFIGFIAGLLLFSVFFDRHKLGNNLWALALGSAIIFVMGVWDDLKSWKPRYKLLAQCLGAVIVLAGNFTFSRITLGPVDFVWDMGLWKYPITFIWIIGVTNAFNLIDGLDGLAGSLATLAAIIYALYFYNYGNNSAALVCLLLGASVSGFLFFNLPFPKAKIFMGDGGSQFLGFVLSVLPLMNAKDGFATIALPYAAAVLMIPIYDTIAAVWRRTREKRRFDSPDRFHLHHKLMLMGFSVKETLGIVVALQILIGIFVSCAVWIRGYFAGVLLFAVYLTGILFFSVIHFRKKEILMKSENSAEIK
jgi:UDP-GlcNAc:undecaprenyl-phosphate GlcNAc-1-phosphate transferase